MANEGRRAGAVLRRWLLFWSIAVGGTTFDLVTKSIVFNRIGPAACQDSRRSFPGSSSCTRARIPVHSGVFGAGLPGSSLIFAGLSVVAAGVIFYYLFVLGAAANRVLTVALGLIMAGAMGNCYDRLAFGHVRDFVHFHVDAINFDCAIFNFADNMLVIGACTLVLYALRPEKPQTDQPVQTAGWMEGTHAGLSEAERVDGSPVADSRTAPSLPSA